MGDEIATIRCFEGPQEDCFKVVSLAKLIVFFRPQKTFNATWLQDISSSYQHDDEG